MITVLAAITIVTLNPDMPLGDGGKLVRVRRPRADDITLQAHDALDGDFPRVVGVSRLNVSSLTPPSQSTTSGTGKGGGGGENT